MAATENISDLKRIKPVRVLLPVLLGLGIVAYFIADDIDDISFRTLHFSFAVVAFVVVAFGMMAVRDIGYIIRIKILSDNKLTWMQSVRIIFLWEFTSAITPSAVGGTAFATLFVWKEGISVGKSTSMVMATSFLDELYFSLMFPLTLLLFSKARLFDFSSLPTVGNCLFYFALTGYLLKLAWTLTMAFALFVRPKVFGSLVKRLFRLRFLRRWSDKASRMADDFEVASVELKTKKPLFWLKSFAATFVSWTARYWVLNFLLMALLASLRVDGSISVGRHLLIFAKQLIMWIMMLVMPTPGGSGFVEVVFNSYMNEFIPVAGMTIIMALLWRLITYYPYLIIGVAILPKWISRIKNN